MRIAVITTKIAAKHPKVGFEALKQKEIPVVVMKWKQEGLIENLFVHTDTNGAMLIFQGLTMKQAVKNMEYLPFFTCFRKAAHINYNKIF